MSTHGASKRMTKHGQNHGGVISDRVAAVGDDIVELAQSVGKVARDQMNPIQEYISAKPLKSMLIAVGVGALVGALFLRK